MHPSCEPPSRALVHLTAELIQLTEYAIDYRDSKGFWAASWDTLPHRLCSLYREVGELEEALRCIREHEWRRAVRDECADCLIYALTLLHDLFPEQLTARLSYHGGVRIHGTAPETLVKPLRAHLDQVTRDWQRGDRRDAQIALELFVTAVTDLHNRLFVGAGLIADARHKLDVMNRTRESLHGGKDPRC